MVNLTRIDIMDYKKADDDTLIVSSGTKSWEASHSARILKYDDSFMVPHFGVGLRVTAHIFMIH